VAAKLTVGLLCTPVAASTDWQSFWATATKAVPSWKPETPLYVHMEAVSKCILEQHSLDQVPPAPVDAFEGRVFDAHAELRWRRSENGFVGHVVQEGVSAELVTPSEQKYYLIGVETKVNGVFTEGRYPGKEFRYPVNSGADNQRRVFITVVEYRRAEPTWTSISDADNVEEMLDRPLLVEHRFIGVGI